MKLLKDIGAAIWIGFWLIVYYILVRFFKIEFRW